MSGDLYNSKYAKWHRSSLNKAVNNALQKHVLKVLDVSEGDEILEVGCNQGDFVRQIRPHCSKVVGIDINKQAIEASDCVGLYAMDATTMEFDDSSFDKIVSFHTIEHIPALESVFGEIDRILKPNGIAVLAYPCEPIKGMACVGTAVLVHHDVRTARKMHLHKLNKRKIQGFANGTSLGIKTHSLVFTPWPMFVTTFVKLNNTT